jgi:signal peptide peptidase SppA
MSEQDDSSYAAFDRAWRSVVPIEKFRNPPSIVAVIPLSGVIGSIGPMRRGMSLSALGGIIERAFRLPRLKAVALAINSPGGSPVQSNLIANHIRFLAKEKDIPVFAFAEDVAASGGYILALAADEIYADESSIVGSIGVVTSSFGFDGLIKKIGVERRLYTAGKRKASLDPFLGEKAEDVKHLRKIQNDMHETFKGVVRDSRKDRLVGKETELFSGEFWTGKQALELGLIDGIGDLRSVMRKRFGDDIKFRSVELRRPWWRRPFGANVGSGGIDSGNLTRNVVEALYEHSLWSRFGL